MTRQCAQVCGIAHLIDTRFEGQAVGVGTGIILGRIHLVEMKIGTAHFPITIVSLYASLCGLLCMYRLLV